MSTCPKKDLYSAFVDDEVPSPWKEKLEMHISTCATCKEIVENYRHLKKQVMNSTVPDLNIEEAFIRFTNRKDSDLIHNAPEFITEKQNWFTRSLKIPIPALAAAILLFVFLPVFMINTKKQSNESYITASNFDPIMPTQVVFAKQQAKKFNFNELHGINLNMANEIKKNENKRVSFNRFINLYLPRKNNENDVEILNNFDTDIELFQNSVETFAINYNKDGK